MSGFQTYFIRSVHGGPIKVGKARNVQKRIAELQTASPMRLIILGAIERDCEAALHARFSRFRMAGEWFQPDQELIDFIKTSSTLTKDGAQHFDARCVGNWDEIARGHPASPDEICEEIQEDPDEWYDLLAAEPLSIVGRLLSDECRVCVMDSTHCDEDDLPDCHSSACAMGRLVTRMVEGDNVIERVGVNRSARIVYFSNKPICSRRREDLLREQIFDIDEALSIDRETQWMISFTIGVDGRFVWLKVIDDVVFCLAHHRDARWMQRIAQYAAGESELPVPPEPAPLELFA